MAGYQKQDPWACIFPCHSKDNGQFIASAVWLSGENSLCSSSNVNHVENKWVPLARSFIAGFGPNICVWRFHWSLRFDPYFFLSLWVTIGFKFVRLKERLL